MRVRLLLAVAVAATLACATTPPPPSSARPLFALQSNLWINLHHFLRATARGQPMTVKLTPEEQVMWDKAVAAYATYATRDLLFDEGMLAIKDALRVANSDAALPEIASAPGLAVVLNDVAPLYRKYWWPGHATVHRSWSNAVEPLLERYGPRLSADLAAAYETSWPNTPIPVDLSINAGAVGAYTTSPPHTTISSIDPSYSGLAALEMLFHEASHQWGKRVSTTIAASAERHGKTVPRQLWHAVVFYIAGELTRRHLRDDGIGGYTEYAREQKLYEDLCGSGCRERVAKHLAPRLDRSVSLDAALDNLVADWPSP